MIYHMTPIEKKSYGYIILLLTKQQKNDSTFPKLKLTFKKNEHSIELNTK